MFEMPKSEGRKGIYRGGAGWVGTEVVGVAAHLLAPLPLKFCALHFASWLRLEKRRDGEFGGGKEKLVKVDEIM